MFNANIVAETMHDGLPLILNRLLQSGTVRESRAGTVKELPMARIHFTNPSHNLYSTTPLRRASVRAQIAEAVWILSGRNDIQFIERYLPRAKDFSDDGVTWRGGYGPRIRNWGGVDQLFEVAKLLNKDPDSRRAVINIFDPGEDFQDSKDIPCNNWLSFIIREGKLHTHVAVRSNDAFWGLSGINYFEWTLLGQVLAYLVGVKPGTLTFSTTSLHLYERHWARANELVDYSESVGGVEFAPGKIFGTLSGQSLEDPGYTSFEDRWDCFERGLEMMETFLEMPKKDQLNMSDYHALNQPFQLFHQWAQAITGELLSESSSLSAAVKATPKPKVELIPEVSTGDFHKFVGDLHQEKNAAYGDSWMRRGEMLGIMANIARKVDRLGIPGAGDNELDTDVDLLLYLIKYQLWLVVRAGYTPDAVLEGERHHENVMQRLEDARARRLMEAPEEDPVALLRKKFEELTVRVEGRLGFKYTSRLVETMIDLAYYVASKEHWKSGLATKQFTGYDV